MASEQEVSDLLAQLAAKGYKASDIMKGMKSLKSQGLLKSGRGKAPSDDPTRNAIRDFILNGTINVNGKQVKVLDAVNTGLGVGEDKAGSFLVTLGDKFQLNFIEKKPKVKKEKKDGTVATEAVKTAMTEPAIA